MMSCTYFVLYLLFAIKCSLCYDYIQEKFQYKYEQSPPRKERVHRAKSMFETNKSILKKQPYYESLRNKKPVTQIDVNSFIQKPDDYAIQDNLLNEIDLRKSNSKSNKYDEYRDLSATNMENRKFQYFGPSKEKQHMNINLHSYKDSINPEYANHYPSMRSSIISNKDRSSENQPSYFEMFSADNKVHKPQKKSPFKFMKIPFFSHGKNETQKIKKNKKRKMFCFDCPKNENKLDETPIEAVKDSLKKDEIESLNVLPLNKDGSDDRPNSTKTARKKRDEWVDDRERQLKELEDIQRKVDDVEISSPNTRRNE